jgi:hypothetical protein
MRFCCGPIFLFLFFITGALNAQVAFDDTIPVGVIVVHRPPVQAAFYVQKMVLYPDGVSDFPNLPVSSAFIDSGSAAVDNGPSPNYGEGKFSSWNDVLKPVKHAYAWSDSTRTDSARFIYTIDKRGKAKCEAFPYESADSSGQAFQAKVYKYLVLLDSWAPARVPKRSSADRNSRKTKRVPCTVIITVYAYDPYAGRLVPLGPER